MSPIRSSVPRPSLTATFDGPARAIRCACAARDAVREIGVEIRAGLHTGEVERRGTAATGLAVHVGARVAGLAHASEVLVIASPRWCQRRDLI